MGSWVVAGLLTAHGLIHLLGVTKAFGLADVPQLTQGISRSWGVAWGACAMLFVVAAIARLANAPWWWLAAAPALVVSQAAIVAFWSDARFGTVANALLIVPVVMGFGSWRFAAQVDRELAQLRDQVAEAPSSIVGAEELKALPRPVAAWLKKAGIVGQARARTVYLTQQGTMQTSADGDWMPFRAEQWFTVAEPGFLWFVDVDSGFGLSLVGRDLYVKGRGSMRIELLSVVPVVDATGPKIDQGTLVRFLAEIMWFPSAALRPNLEWEAIDERTARVTTRHRGIEASGVFRFNTQGDVIGFEAKRYRDEVLEDWLIENDPSAFEQLGGVRIPTRSTITWRNDAGESWTWLRLQVTSVERNVTIAR